MRPVRHLSVRAGLGFTDATFRRDVPVIGSKAGDRLTDMPRWTYSGSADYEVPVGGDLGVVLHADARRVGSSITGFGEGELVERPAYMLVNASAGLAGSRWELSVFVQNLTDTTPVYAWKFSTSPRSGARPTF